MGKELKLILPMLGEVATEKHGNTTFHTGTLRGNRIVAMECGIGKVNAAIGTTTLIDAFSPDLVINTGVAAGASDDVAVMDVVVATGLVHHDFWCIGEEWGQVPGSPLILPAVDYPDIVAGDHVRRGIIATGELFITKKEEVDAIRSRFPGVKAIDMESAAIAQACFLRGIPFFCMRVISDSPWSDHDNSRQYEDFWEDAPRHSFALVSNLIDHLS